MNPGDRFDFVIHDLVQYSNHDNFSIWKWNRVKARRVVQADLSIHTRAQS